jgi:hypothetical protein
MIITTFRNNKGIIHGEDQKRVTSDIDGVLKVGTTEITVSSEGESILPLLYYGGTGRYKATFTNALGRVYDLNNVLVRDGRIAPLTKTEAEIMELRCRAEMAEEERDGLRRDIEELQQVFDTNSLNFLIK